MHGTVLHSDISCWRRVQSSCRRMPTSCETQLLSQTARHYRLNRQIMAQWHPWAFTGPNGPTDSCQMCCRINAVSLCATRERCFTRASASLMDGTVLHGNSCTRQPCRWQHCRFIDASHQMDAQRHCLHGEISCRRRAQSSCQQMLTS